MTDRDQKKVKGKRNKPPGAPTRPLSAYNHFFSEMRKKIISETNDGTTGGFSSLAKHISCLWKEISDVDRQKYNNMAKDSWEKYALLRKDWLETEHYKSVLNKQREKKMISRANYRARVKSKRIQETSNFQQGYPVSSLIDFIDGNNHNIFSQADYHKMNLHDITVASDRTGTSVGTIEEDEMSQFTESCHGGTAHHDFYNINDILVPSELNQDAIRVPNLSANGALSSIDQRLEYSSSCLHAYRDDVATLEHDGDQFVQGLDQVSCHGTIPHHDLYNINDILVPDESIQDEKSVSGFSANVALPSIDQQLEYSSRFLHGYHSDIATLEHDGDQFVQGLDQERNCANSYISNQEITSPNYDLNPGRVLTPSLSMMQPGISEIQRLYLSRQETGSLNFPIEHQRKFGIDGFAANSFRLVSPIQHDRVVNTTNRLFSHSIYNDACMPMNKYNTVGTSKNKQNCRFVLKDCLPPKYDGTSSCAHNPYNVTNHSLDVYSNCNE